MPTILLQEIRDLLTGFLTAIQAVIESMLTKLDNIKEDTENLNTLPDIKDDTGNIATDVDSIETNVTNTIAPGVTGINNKATTLVDKATSIDNKATTALQDLDTIINTNNDIKNNTSAVITPVARLDTNVTSILVNTNALKSNSDIIKQYIPIISDNAGEAASYTGDIATNTLNSYNKLTTISEDTTQIRADNQVIIDLLRDILTTIGGTHT